MHTHVVSFIVHVRDGMPVATVVFRNEIYDDDDDPGITAAAPDDDGPFSVSTDAGSAATNLIHMIISRARVHGESFTRATEIECVSIIITTVTIIIS